MGSNKIPYMNRPCGNCPFRKDSQGIKRLGVERAKELLKDNETDGFVCHKTAYKDGERKRKQCAGAMILSKKTNTFQPFAHLYESVFGEEIPLSGHELIVDTAEEFINEQS